MFLKRVEMQGFKSFADKTIISFEQPITGIVGPNGCGKSNISDAIRWVLGEQSAKSMRGDKMNDVIFAGSADRKKVNLAEVTLVFDNSQHILNSEETEIEITRKLYRDSGDAFYLINKKNVRLRDVVDLFLDTGLGKDSLSIISQGNIIGFAESKPQDRRAIFEEAAGVAKYKKRRIESLSKLEKTKDNLNRSIDILNELERQVSPLKRQAKKALLYREKKERLEQIEIQVLVQEIDEIQNGIDSAKKALFDIETSTTILQTDISVSEEAVHQSRSISNALDKDIAKLQDDYMKVLDQIQNLEARRTELDEKRKYIIEQGNQKQKIEETRQLLQEARAEYEDRKERLDELNHQIALFSEQVNQAALHILDAREKFDRSQAVLRTLENRQNVVEQLMKNPFGNQTGIRAIMDHRQSLQGILGVVGQVLKANNGYEEAIATALGGALNNIVTQNEACAREAIRFLVRNQSGRATFLPLNVLQNRWVNKETLIICENTEGYLGIASAFVTNESIFDPVVNALLNNVIVCKDMEAGNEISRLTNRQFKIVTLNGEVIHRGGSMTGGKTRQSNNIMTIQKEADELRVRLDAQKAETAIASKKFAEANQNRENASKNLQEARFAAAALEPVVDVKKSKYEKLKNELSLLHPEEEEEESHADVLIDDLNKAYRRRDEISNNIKTKRERRLVENQSAERKEMQLRQMRKDLAAANAGANAIQLDQAKLETRLETNLNRLSSEYALTYEFAKSNHETIDVDDLVKAREEVSLLRSEISRLGNVNMNAPEEYEEINARYETLQNQVQELTESRDKILRAIDDMDTVMKKQFKDMFDKINLAFDDIFRSLYGGGRATLTLQDPTDILNTGIEIDAQPPGKSVQNNMLFSGGEKSLIALCVLFAILKVKPVPLVILDEVEAALDPSNVERFAQYLHQFTMQTQFLVVTHRVGTMEKADVLYGVTMQHQGVSQMLKVNLKEAISMAEPTAKE